MTAVYRKLTRGMRGGALACAFFLSIFPQISFGLSPADFEQGQKFLGSGEKSEWQKALKIGQAGLARNSADWQALYLIGTYERLMAMRTESVNTFTKAISGAEKSKESKDRLSMLYVARADANSIAGQWHEVLADGRQATRLNPDNHSMHYLVADAYMNLGEYEAAFRELALQDKVAGPLAHTAVVRADFYRRMNRIGDSLRCLDDALNSNPRDVELIQQKISMLLLLKRAEDAQTELKNAIEKFPQLASNFAPIAALLRKQGKFAQARSAMDKWVECCPDGSAFAARAAVHHKEGHDDLAIADYCKAIKREPSNLTYLDSRGRLYELTKNYRKAFDDYDYLVKHTKDSQLPRQYGNRGLIYFRQGNFAAAIPDLNKLLAVENDRFIYSVRIRCFMGLHKDEEALRDLNAFCEKHPELIEFRAMRAEVLEKKGELDKALAEMNLVIARSKFNPAFYSQRARVLDRLHKHEDAQRDLNEAKRLKELEKRTLLNVSSWCQV